MPTGMHAPPSALTKKAKKQTKKTLNVRSQADQSENSLIMHPRCKLQNPENQKKIKNVLLRKPTQVKM